MLNASSSKKFVRFWFLTVDPDVTDVNVEKVIEKIATTLKDPRGISRLGYQFQQILTEVGISAREQKENMKYIFHIHVSTEKTIKEACGFQGLNCADLKDNIIFIHRDLWLHGSKVSRLSIDDYRTYLINHEILHLLGRGHKKCTSNVNDLCPVMYQQTISKGCCKPNPYPFDWE